MVHRLFKWHRRIGLLTCFGLFCWGFSGMLHPVMMHWQPQPATQMPPAQSILLKDVTPLMALLKQHGISNVRNIHLIRLEGQAYYQVIVPGQAKRLYFNLQDGSLLRNGDSRYAIMLARHYLNDRRSPVQSIERIARYTDEYPQINRLLPVYRVKFDRADGMRAYIDTEGARLATLVDHPKALLSLIFSLLHTWSFLRANPMLKYGMLILLMAVAASSMTGIWLYFATRKKAFQRLKNAPLRQFHRSVGLLVSVTTLTFSLSGFYHLIHGLSHSKFPTISENSFNVAELESVFPAALRQLSLQTFGFSRVNGQPYYRIAQKNQQSAFNAKDAENHAQRPQALSSSVAVEYLAFKSGHPLTLGDRRYAEQLASAYSHLPTDRILSVERVDRFNNEYGFIFKRLPVFRIAYDTPDNALYFVETSTDQLAAKLTKADAQEGWVFANVHKWAFVGPWTDARDVLAVCFAFGNALIALTGLCLFLKNPRY